MARLTEEMVVARSRVSDLGLVKKLNCWGAELTDVSVLRRMLNLEVLSISVNKIASLVDFQNCKSLRELYVRNNEIRTLNEICYLQDLPALRILWLAENPCAKEDVYRLTVLKALPRLEKLDDVIVQPEEIEDAQRKGRDLMHPEEMEDIPEPQPQPRPKTSVPRGLPPRQLSQHHIPEPLDCDEEARHRDKQGRPPQARKPSHASNERVAAQSARQVPNQYYEPEDTYMEAENYRNNQATNYGGRRPSDVTYEPVSVVSNGSENSVCDKCNSPLSPHSHPQSPIAIATPPAATSSPTNNGSFNYSNTTTTTNHQENGVAFAAVNGSSNCNKDNYDPRVDYRRRGSSSSSNDSCRSRSRTNSPRGHRRLEHEENNEVNYNRYNADNNQRYSMPSPPRRPSRPSRPHEEEDQRYADRLNPYSDDYQNGSHYEQQRWTQSERNAPESRRPLQNSNVLTAVMYLIKDLDYDQLGKVEKCIRRRKEEIIASGE